MNVASSKYDVKIENNMYSINKRLIEGSMLNDTGDSC